MRDALLPPPLPLYARLRDRLRERILDGRLRAGDKLPSESELTATEGVSRITVRQALSELQQEGLIVKLHGKGAFVSHPRAAQNLNRLQGLAEALALQGQTVHSKRLSLKEVAPPTAVARQLQLAAGDKAWQLLTLRYLDREPLSVNTSYLPHAVGAKLARASVANRDLIDYFETDLGLIIERAQLEIRARTAIPRHARLLHLEAGAPVLEVERVLFAKGGRAVQSETAVYHAEAFSYKMELRR